MRLQQNINRLFTAIRQRFSHVPSCPPTKPAYRYPQEEYLGYFTSRESITKTKQEGKDSLDFKKGKQTFSIYANWYSSGFIYLQSLLEEGSHGDEDGYGVEPDIFVVAIINENGDVVLPFCLDDSREAQWTAYDCGIIPISINFSIAHEYERANNRKLDLDGGWY
jgi:hypothetical protein